VQQSDADARRLDPAARIAFAESPLHGRQSAPPKAYEINRHPGSSRVPATAFGVRPSEVRR
jgi:hypothetical protein